MNRISGMSPRTKRKLGIIAAVILVCAIACVLLLLYVPPGGIQFKQENDSDVLAEIPAQFTAENFTLEEPPYGKVLAQYEAKGYKDYTGPDIHIAGESYSKAEPKVSKQIVEGISSVITDGESSWVEWEIFVPKDALYQIDMKYYALDGKQSGVERSFMIDGKRPFQEASGLLFPRLWKSVASNKTDNRDNEIRAPQTELLLWQEKPFEHPQGLYKRPYKIYLSSGKHTVRLDDLREPMAIGGLVVKRPLSVPAYRDVAAEYEKKGYKPSGAASIKVQAEYPASKSELSHRSVWIDDPMAEPKAVGVIKYNTFDGDRWKRGGQTVNWEFDVPADGLYKLVFRYATPTDNQVSRREIRLDGEIPFQEMEEYTFPFIRGWRADELKDENNKPYLFYLKKGNHTISMTSKIGPLRQTIQRLREVGQEMSLLSRQIVQVTASSKDATGKITSDRYQDWDLEIKIPNLITRLGAIRDVIAESSDIVIAANGGRRPTFVSAFMSASHLLAGMMANTEKIPYQLNEFGTTQSSLGQALLKIQEQPLYIDYMVASSPEMEHPSAATSYGQNLVAAYKKFILSFSENATQVGNVYSGKEDEEGPVLTVWVARGREWVELLKEMIDEEFTPRTGIKVNINTVPLNSEHLLLLAYTAGKAPDVALGVQPQVPVEFAIRNALYDLNKFPDVNQVMERFTQSALIPYEYNNGLYAIPETQDFQMLFYRTDILNSLNEKPPETWQDVYKLLPKLQEFGMDFYYPDGVAGYTPFLFQHGGNFYSKDGLKSGLESASALAAFKEWTNLFNNYKLPLKADFYQRIRTGEMPVGIGNYELYVRLATAAPELNGRWKMAPLPGILNDKGVVDRSSGGSGQTGIIMNSTNHPDASWELLKWWTSAEVQIRFGQEVEGMLGVGSRWNTANVEALKGMAWNKQEIASIIEQWSWFKEQPIVLGGYYTARHVLNAWNESVLIGKNTRISLETAVKSINKELVRKQEEFKFHPLQPTDPLEKGALSDGN